MIDTSSDATAGPAWRPFLVAFAATALVLSLCLYGFALALDPFGVWVRQGGKPAPLMDINQRYMYPQLIRSGRFDGAIFGTSTMRLVDPAKLGPAFGAHLANFAMNAASIWEQMQLADLFLRHEPAPKLMIFGLDHTWCAPDATDEKNRLSFRGFPPWLYAENRLAMVPELFNLKTVEIAGRVLLNRLGLMKARLRDDGYGVFTPPESRYNLAQAQGHIWQARKPGTPPVNPPVELSDAERQALRFPAMRWLAELIERLPASTRVIAIFPPIHVAAQAIPGSREAAVDAACKQAAEQAILRHPATIIDFRRPSPITSEDSHYWDGLHYRVGIADQIVADIKAAAATGQSAPDGSYTVVENRTGP